MIYITKADYISDYKIRLAFSDHKEGIVDLKDVLANDHRSVFKSLLDIEKFKRFKVEMYTLVWENGLDLAPEFLYKKIVI